jgi:hypothetical protein
MIYTNNPTIKKNYTCSFQSFKKSIQQNDSIHKFDIKKNLNDYIKGVSYNPGHDWRDNKGSMPLTKDKLEKDLGKIKEMGANTIRRYSPTIYDKALIKVAKEKGLKILYGFWFDSKIDFLKDKRKIGQYERQVLKFVNKHKTDSTIVGWSLGNETWGLLKRNFNEPYLSFVRKAYVEMVAEVAVKIRDIDSLHPIFVMEEHTDHLSSAAYAFMTYAPKVDILGINSYYEQNISMLDSLMTDIMPDKPCLVSEFGPKGYWHHEYNDYYFDDILFEQSSQDKAFSFIHQWNDYIVNNKEHNIGGIAFCWQDRFEGTSTWFGITDIYDNKKPAWYALNYCFKYLDTLQYPLPEYLILTPKDYLLPNMQTKVIAATKNTNERDQLYFKWMIYEESTFRKILETPFTKGEYNYSFKVPSKKSDYRLYLYVSDLKGNVTTESSPLLINWE